MVFGRDHLRIDRLPAADPLGPATRRFPCEGADRGKELRHVSRGGAVSLSSPARRDEDRLGKAGIGLMAGSALLRPLAAYVKPGTTK